MGDNKERTLFCGNLSEEVTEEILYELFLQAGPVESVKIPKEKAGRNKNYGFVVFKHEVSVPYTVALFQGISLYGRELQLDYRTGSGSIVNKYLETIMAHKNVVVGQRERTMGYRRSSSYPEEAFAQNSYYNFNTPSRENSQDYHPRRIADRVELPQRPRINEDFMPLNAQMPIYMDSRMLPPPLHLIHSPYGRSPYTPPTHSHRSQRHDHRDSPIQSSRDKKYH